MQKSCKQLFRLVSLALAVIWCLPVSSLAAPKGPEIPQTTLKVTVLATAGMNGHIIDWDYYLPKTADFGLAKISSLVKKERQSNPYTILVDGGNMLSGSPLTDYYASAPSSKLPNPMISMYNYLGYDAVVLGEGEFAYGSSYLSKALTRANFPVLAANAHTSGKDWSAIKPYIIKEFIVGKDKKKEKIRIAIVGASTGSSAVTPQTFAGLKFEDQTAAITATTKKLQKTVDAIIIVKNDSLEVNGIRAATPGKFGSSLSKTELTFQKVGKKWWHSNTETASIYAVIAPADKTMTDIAWPYHDATLQHIETLKVASEQTTISAVN